MTKLTKNKIDGVILLDKESGITSNRALQQVKHLLKAQKAGHTGSLDPLASGLLPICLGEASKFARFLLDADKTYEVSARLGVTTDSGDSCGNILEQKAIPKLTVDDILAYIQPFIGASKQIPSMFSALKHQGQPLYKLARQNITIERPARDIFVYEYALLDFDGESITCRVKCSKGTYIRSLIEDLGQKIGCGAHVTMLRRTGAGPFKIESATTFANLEANNMNFQDFIYPMDVLLQGLPQIQLSVEETQAIVWGQKIKHLAPNGIVCLYNPENTLIGIGDAQNDGNIVALRLVAHTGNVV